MSAKQTYIEGLGRRKTAVARVRLKSGSGGFVVNGRPINEFFTTLRDLGTEGAGYADAGLKQAVNQGIIPGPRLLVTTRAIVATGTYAPKGFSPLWTIPQGAEEADGPALVRVVREQAARVVIEHVLRLDALPVLEVLDVAGEVAEQQQARGEPHPGVDDGLGVQVVLEGGVDEARVGEAAGAGALALLGERAGEMTHSREGRLGEPVDVAGQPVAQLVLGDGEREAGQQRQQPRAEARHHLLGPAHHQQGQGQPSGLVELLEEAAL